jgi:hypothetical protein
MVCQPTHVIANAATNLARIGLTIEECDVLHPGDADDDAESAAGRLVEQRDRRRGLCANGVGFELGDRIEVAGDAIRVGK